MDILPRTRRNSTKVSKENLPCLDPDSVDNIRKKYNLTQRQFKQRYYETSALWFIELCVAENKRVVEESQRRIKLISSS